MSPTVTEEKTAVQITVGGKPQSLLYIPGMTVMDAKSAVGAEEAKGATTVNEREAGDSDVLKPGDLVVVTPIFEAGR